MFQEAPPPVPTVEEVVITGARLPAAESEAAFAVIRLDRADLDRSIRLDEALTQVPAVSLFRRNTSLSANPTTQGISLRAIAPSGAGRTLVTLDGVPLNDPFGGWVIWSQVPPESLSGLDVIRGAGAGPYGAGALTGVIQLRERDAGAVLDAAVAERGGRRAAFSGGQAFGPVNLVASLGHESTDGHRAIRGDDAGLADVPLDYESWSGALRLDAPLPGGGTVSARAGAYEEERGSGLVGGGSAVEGNLLSVTAARAPDSDSIGYRAQVWRSESDLQNSFVAVAADRAATNPASEQYASPATGWGANLALRGRMGALEIEGGADARLYDGETREFNRFMNGAFTRERRAGGEASTMGAYVDGSWSDDLWLVAGGLRVDRWEANEGFRVETDLENGGAPVLDNRPDDRSGEVFSGRLAARRAISGTDSIRAAAYSGFRAPTLNELHRPFRVGNDITEANPELEPETLQGVELGWARAIPDGQITLTAFANRIEDAIVNVTIGFGPGTFPIAGFVPAGGVLRQRQNAGTIEAVGVEAAAERDFGAVSLRGAVSYTDAEMDGGIQAAQLTGLRPAQAPEWSATAGLSWQATPRLTLDADGRFESKRFDDDLNSRVLDAAVVLDARATYAVRDDLFAYVAADNLFDEDVETAETGDGVASYGPPQTLRIGLTWRR